MFEVECELHLGGRKHKNTRIAWRLRLCRRTLSRIDDDPRVFLSLTFVSDTDERTLFAKYTRRVVRALRARDVHTCFLVS
jgi:hypothetical protein